jgi:ribosomal-protein-serine acetyltransferase
VPSANPTPAAHRAGSPRAVTPGAPARLELPGALPLRADRELRLLEESDAEELYGLIDANRAELARWLPWAAGQTLLGTLEFLRAARAQIAECDGFHAAVVHAERIVGVIGFHGIDWQHRATSLGYWLDKDAQGRGTMTDAVRAMVTHALDAWALNRVEIRASVENERSRALIERLGFHYEGVAREAFLLADGFHDDAVYSMLAADWPGPAASA